jgi:hypothetical protein
MQSLDPDEIKPLELDWTTTNMIRTGVPMDGSCFFHSLFYAYRTFRELTEEGRVEYIKQKRSDLAVSLTINKWLSMQNGSVALIQISEIMRTIIVETPDLIIGASKSDSEIMQILFALLDTHTIDQHILPEWDTECSHTEENFDSEVFLNRMKSSWYQLFYNYIVKHIEHLEKEYDPPMLMSTEERLKVVHKLASMSYIIFDMVLKKAYEQFQKEIKEPSSWIDIYSLLYIIDELDLAYNIILIDATTGQVFKGMKMFSRASNDEEDNTYMILLYFPEFHFESVGKIMYAEDDVTKSVSRFFTNDDDIIQKVIL